MKKVLILLILLHLNLFANNNGRYAGSYTRLGLGAKAIAMGNSGVATPAAGYSFYYNPALAGNHEGKIFSNTYTSKVPPGAGFSLAWLKTGTGDTRSFNSIGQDQGSIDQSAHAIYGSFSRQFTDKFSVGITIKILLEYISDHGNDFNYESSGVGGDIGVHYQFDERLSFGIVYKDFGSNLTANTEKIFSRGGTTTDNFPKLLRMGTHYKTPLDWLNAAYDFEMSSKDEYTNHFGIEAVHKRNIALRLGFMDFREDSERKIQFFAGAGIEFILYNYISHLDYAFLSSKIDEGSSHLFSWEIYF
jgi:hypothetical protein